jgi:hypothetical protein
MFKVEKGVPHPGKGGKYPWSTMEIGESFFVPDSDGGAPHTAAHAAGRRLGRKFTTKKVDGGRRVWRVA